MATRETNLINPNAEIVASSQCLMVNVAAARGLQSVLKSNLGPRGTLKMLVGGAGQIKITKDGNVLLHEMQIQHPTAMMIARAATAMDDEVGDGTTSTVLFIGELLKQAERFTSEGTHPRLLTEGMEAARDMSLEFLEGFKVGMPEILRDREVLIQVARTSLRSKLSLEIADTMAEAIVDAVSCIANAAKSATAGSQTDITVDDDTADGQATPNNSNIEGIDLHMVETLEMMHRSASDSAFIPGIVLDHGARHPDMPRYLEHVHLLTCNVSMEYEKTEISAGFYYNSAEQREKLVESERKFTDDKVKQVIALKRQVCPPGSKFSFAIMNQKGIDPASLDMLAKEGIYAVRRAKRRNMERVTRACGGTAVNSFDDLDESSLGYVDRVREETLGEEKYTFLEQLGGSTGSNKTMSSCTLLIKGPNKHTLDQLKDATRDGLRAVKCAIEERALVPGGGAFEIACANMLRRRKMAVQGRAKLGVEAFAEALLIIPKTLVENSGLDVQEALIKVQEEYEQRMEEGSGVTGKAALGLDLISGEPMVPSGLGIWDSVIVKRQVLSLATVLASQLLLVDEVMKAGKAMGKSAAQQQEEAADME